MIEETIKPSLFGIKHSNRDFSDRNTWGKNQFNSSFPAALSAYLSHKDLENIYLKINPNFEVYQETISTENLFGLPPEADNLFYSFESQFLPYQKFLIGNIPRIDLVTQNKDIILGGGQNLLSPERRFDAIIFNSPDLF